VTGFSHRDHRDHRGAVVGDPAITEEIIAAAIEVHRHLGPGLLEKIYEEALCYELDLRGVPYERQKTMEVVYKGKLIQGQRFDLVVRGQVIVDVKSLRANQDFFAAQMLSYLRVTGLRTGLVINFGLKRLVDGVQRFAD